MRGERQPDEALERRWADEQVERGSPGRPGRRRLGRKEKRAIARAAAFYAWRESWLETNPRMKMQWQSKRGLHLTAEGRFWASVAVATAGVVFAAVLVVPSEQQTLPNAFLLATAMGVVAIVYGLIHTSPPDTPFYRDRETAIWSLDVSAQFLRLTRQRPSGVSDYQEIERADAGDLEVVFRWPAFFGRVDEAGGGSIDGTTQIWVPNWRVRTAGGKRANPAMLLGLWWPHNDRTALPLAQLMIDSPLDT